MIWVNDFTDGVLLFIDGSGYRTLTEDLINHEDFPTLILNGTVTADAAESHAEISETVEIFRTSLEGRPVKSSFSKLSSLEPGEYFIVFEELNDTRLGDESITNYCLICDDCIFKLIVN